MTKYNTSLRTRGFPRSKEVDMWPRQWGTWAGSGRSNIHENAMAKILRTGTSGLLDCFGNEVSKAVDEKNSHGPTKGQRIRLSAEEKQRNRPTGKVGMKKRRPRRG